MKRNKTNAEVMQLSNTNLFVRSCRSFGFVLQKIKRGEIGETCYSFVVSYTCVLECRINDEGDDRIVTHWVRMTESQKRDSKRINQESNDDLIT